MTVTASATGGGMNAFLTKYGEKEDLNQYWYSDHTIKVMVEEVMANATKACFLSTPSIYFSLPKKSEVRKQSWLFDLDDQWANLPNYFKYDFNFPEQIPKELHGTFDYVVIDPPFITEEVWEKYSEATKLLLSPQGKVLLTTIQENAPMLDRLLDVKPREFAPSIPHLVYQYALYTNYESDQLAERNPEIPVWD